MSKTDLRAALLGTVIAALCLPASATEPDPITADPADFVARLSMPDSVDVAEGGVEATLSAVLPDTGQRFVERYILRPAQEPGHFVFSTTDRVRVARQQGLIRQYMDAGIDVDGSFSVTLDPCVTGLGQPRRARVSIDLQADQESGFINVVDDMRLRRLIGHSISELQPCS